MLRSHASTPMDLLIEELITIGLQRCNKMLSFNLKCRHIAVIFSDEIISTVDAIVFVEMTYSWQSY